MNDDTDLRELFVRQREAEQETAPEYGLLLQRASTTNSARSRRVPLWGIGAVSSGLAVTAIVTAGFFWQSIGQPSLVESLPVLLPPARQEARLFPDLRLGDETTPSDFLLPAALKISVL